MPEVIRVNVGDRLLFVMDRDVSPKQAAEVHERLKEAFPDVEVTVVSGPSHVVVQSEHGPESVDLP